MGGSAESILIRRQVTNCRGLDVGKGDDERSGGMVTNPCLRFASVAILAEISQERIPTSTGNGLPLKRLSQGLEKGRYKLEKMDDASDSWVELNDPQTRRPFFANTETGECLWELPEGAKLYENSLPCV